jgi:hypothetical protein
VFFSLFVGAIVLFIADRSTARDLAKASQSTSVGQDGEAAPQRRGRFIAAIAMFALAAILVLGSVYWAFVANKPNLVAQTVRVPSAGMVATSVGTGGTNPSRILPAAYALAGIRATGIVPTTPTIFLKPATLTRFGVDKQKEGAYWKVWWDPALQEKDVVSLQAHIDASHAAQQLLVLNEQNADPSGFSGGGEMFRAENTFPIAGIPNASGYLWSGLESPRLHFQFRFAMFSRGPVVALVSTTAFGRSVNTRAFQRFALAEYSKMDHSSSPIGVREATALFIVGLLLAVVAAITLIGARYRIPVPLARAVVTVPQVPAAVAPATTTGFPSVATGTPEAPPVPQPTATARFCSWCGMKRDPDDYSFHSCGSRDRPTAFCSACGADLTEGAAFCTTCGTARSVVSKG